MNKRTPKNIYLTSAQLADALEESQRIGQPTEKVCNYFRLIAKYLLNSHRYMNYQQALKDDMASAALVKCIKNIKNFKQEYRDKCFNYYTRTTECAFFEVLSKHYKHKNLMRQLKLDYADSIEQINPVAAKMIRDNEKRD